MTGKQFFTYGAVAWFVGAAITCAMAHDWYMVRFYALSAAINLSMAVPS